ncbi:preprotein translocase subunit SecD [Candidatus Kryptonium thompsonii]|uniref:Protein translocase subunit SecD n=2 Tax=Candidatus Kryptonium thompsonii TaxID=1633631 RepID=A0A0P1LV39_9BACT|nr:protein translocase subunit SecD [Candidatus Kryptonium thompsoni]CUS79103.1 preprotein translocase subunit SecD [Candidatus Kryptonium thompsoni]CUS85884.1 preprotein translocase subunit SecD [Candidatus Kryptonium thompsoni]CUS86215.1 preprotein translocase subunit SecD [Candidatus Kryptonium thompsoni]CUS87733.1 preprotein translocase subunit SecD [Candidatus Kryptonium thompsoni]CUS87752.1 preprotein translocase subunit SecD [Candidatus Kryptonium thompsoni]
MKKNRWKIILIIISIVATLWYLYPTYKDINYQKKLSELRGEDSLKFVQQHIDDIQKVKQKRIKLGLDLQGGMYVALEVDIVKMLDNLAKNKDETFRQILAEVKKKAVVSQEPITSILLREFQSRGIRLSRYYGDIRQSDSEIISELEKQAEDAVDRALEVIRNRVDKYGVAEPSIQKQGSNRIVVELPGVKERGEVRQLLQSTAVLEFKLLKPADIAIKVMQTIDNYLAGKGVVDTTDTLRTTASSDTTKKDTVKTIASELGADTTAGLSEFERFKKEHPFFAYVRVDEQTGIGFVLARDKKMVEYILSRPDVVNLIPPDFEFVWSAKPFTAQDGNQYYNLLAVKKDPEITGKVITEARATIDPDNNAPIVIMRMNSEGAREWARITGANINKHIAIILDGTAYSWPVVRTKIIGGSSQIEGLDSPEEARLLEVVLKAGALPAPLEIVEERTVGPSLGEDSIQKGLKAALLSFIVIVLFMVIYYSTGGFIANLALVLNIAFILAVLAGFNATLTLPGIAGIVLTIGVAVDANVLIYERIREELAIGRTLRSAIDEGYSKAFSAIFDANITTFLTGLILYNFGSGPIQGFALTLMIGIIANLFSAVFITKVIYDIIAEKYPQIVKFG